MVQQNWNINLVDLTYLIGKIRHIETKGKCQIRVYLHNAAGSEPGFRMSSENFGQNVKGFLMYNAVFFGLGMLRNERII